MKTKRLKKFKLETLAEPIDFLLLGIQTPLKGFRLAYVINQQLALQLRRNDVNLITKVNDFESQFVTFDYFDGEKDISWSLIHNTYKSLHLDKNPFDLFQTEPFYSSRIDYLLPKEKTSNFLLKITGITTDEMEEIAKEIRKIYNVELVKTLDTTTIKNIKRLIF